jgi:hypothetical protein
MSLEIQAANLTLTDYKKPYDSKGTPNLARHEAICEGLNDSASDP